MSTQEPDHPILTAPIHDVARDDGSRYRAAEGAAIEGSIAAFGAALGGVVGPFQIRIEKGEVGSSADL